MTTTAKPLPDGWVEGFDSNYGRPYFFHKPTRRSSWTRPDGLDQDTDTQSSPATSAGGSFRRAQFANSPMQSSFQSSVGSPSSTQQQAVGRFNEWLEVFSPEYNRTFFFNKVTRESTWEDPRDSSSVANGQVTSHRTAFVKTEETPAAFLSIWESVGTDSKRSQQPMDRPQTTPIVSGAKSMASPLQASSFAASSSSPGDPKRSAVPLQQAFDERPTVPPKKAPALQGGKPTNMENPLADELEMYARDIERQNQMVNKHGRDDASKFDQDVDDLSRTAEAVLRTESKDKRRTLSKRLTAEDSALSMWGTEPPKVLDVKRAMQDVKSGMKYVKEELKAQGDANAEAEKVDSEGGYYTILGVPTTADIDMLKKAYRRAMVKCHPDKVPKEEREKAMEKSNMVQNAYNCLCDPWERYLYDYFGLKRYLQNQKVIQCFKNYMLSGIPILKHPRKGYYPKDRDFWISPDYEWLLTGPERILEPTPEQRARMKGVRIKDIIEITRGITTEVFERTGKPKKQSRYFSIITPERTLDLEAPTKERADFLVSRISLLVLDIQKNKKWLQRHFELKALREAADAVHRAAQGYSPKPPAEAPPPDGAGDTPNSSNSKREETKV